MSARVVMVIKKGFIVVLKSPYIWLSAWKVLDFFIMSRNVLEIYARPIFWYTEWLCFRHFKTLNMKRGTENVGKLSVWKSEQGVSIFFIKTWSLKAFPHSLKKPLNLVCLKLYEPCSSGHSSHKNEALVMGKYWL